MPPASDRAETRLRSSYRLAPEVLQASPRIDVGDRRGVVLRSGDRLLVGDDGIVVATERYPVAGGLPHGDGWVFWSKGMRASWYVGRSFLGPLQAKHTIGSSPHRVMLADGRLLVFDDGGTRIFDPTTLRPIAAPWPGLTHYVSDDKHGDFALLEGGWLLAKPRGAATWSERPRQGTALKHQDGQTWLSTGQESYRLDAAGTWTRERRPPPPRYRLRAALGAGVAVGDNQALIVTLDTVSRVDLATGKVLGDTKIPGVRGCSLLGLKQDVLALCTEKHGQRSVLIRNVEQGPKVDHLFADDELHVDPQTGVVAHLGGCDPQKRAPPGAICVRDTDGTWKDRNLDIPGLLVLRQLAMLPRAQGAIPFLALGNIEEAATVERRMCVSNGRAPLQCTPSDGQLPARAGRVRQDLRRAKDGRLVLIGQRMLVFYRGTEASGVVWPEDLSLGGDHILARAGTSYFQSDDLGLNWTEVAAPPMSTPPGESLACSSMGCRVGPFVRDGWPRRTPKSSRELASPHPERGYTVAPYAALRCQESAPHWGRVGEKREHIGGPPMLRYGLGLGAFDDPYPRSASKTVQRLEGGVRRDLTTALLSVVRNEAGDRQTTTLQYVVPFDRAAKIHQYRTQSKAVATMAPSPIRNPNVPDAVQWDMHLHTTPVTGPTPSALVQYRHFGRKMLWLRDGKATELRSAAPPAANVQSAMALSDTTLLVLDERHQLIKLNRNGSSELLPPIAPPPIAHGWTDALVMSEGEVALLRYGPVTPTAAQPALLLRRGQRPTALAPWSSLRLNNDASCADAAPRGFVHITLDSWPLLPVQEAAMRKRATLGVSWSERRVCLESFYAPPSTTSFDAPSDVVAQFGAQTWAQRRDLGIGARLIQPLRCVLGVEKLR